MRTVGFLVAAAVVGLASIAAAAIPQATRTFSGQNEFKVFCASWHGVGAKGDGPIANAFRRRPPDLTQLATRNGGTFPADRVFQTIDGRVPGQWTWWS